jgi:hypothetical protein
MARLYTGRHRFAFRLASLTISSETCQVRQGVRWIIGGLRVLVLTCGAFLLLQPPARGFREDEVECEEAVARLRKCCTSDELAAINCTYDPGCSGTTPSISVSESRCLRELSCRHIETADICQRIFDRTQGVVTTTPEPEQLCP